MNDSSANPSYDVVVIGAGAAGLFAAANAAEAGARTLLIEKMKRPGIKILASGGSKCNVTSTLPIKQLGSWFGVKGERFLRYGLHEYGPKDIREFLHQEGVGTEELPFEKVFPSGGRASDVLRAFLRRLERSGSELRLETPCRGIKKQGDTFVVQTDAEAISTRRVIITSGGASYPKTGCTGDGYAWVKKLGHTVKRPRPALVPLEVQSPWVRALTGIAVPGASVSVRDAKNREAFRRDRPVLFTHRGLSGPGPMDASRYLNEDPDHFRPLIVDWIPHLSREKLAERFRELPGGEPIANRIPDILPRRLARGLVQSARIPNDRRAAELKKDERERLLDALKANPIPVTGDEGFPKAEVTAGGVLLSEVDSRTMASRIVPGLYLAGEILDLDGPIGGFNFQSAFSTGTVAGRAAGTFD